MSELKCFEKESRDINSELERICTLTKNPCFALRRICEYRMNTIMTIPKKDEQHFIGYVSEVNELLTRYYIVHDMEIQLREQLPHDTDDYNIEELKHTIKVREYERTRFANELETWCDWTPSPQESRKCVYACKQAMQTKIPESKRHVFGEFIEYVNTSLTAFVFAKEFEEEAINKLCKAKKYI